MDHTTWDALTQTTDYVARNIARWRIKMGLFNWAHGTIPGWKGYQMPVFKALS